MRNEDMPSLTELQFLTLDVMMDDAEDVEQVYLAINRDCLPQPRFSLGEIIDVIRLMVDKGYIKPDYTNDARLAPLESLNVSLLHHYWFSPTQKGKQAWEAQQSQSAG
jgi:hypothetical protein